MYLENVINGLIVDPVYVTIFYLAKVCHEEIDILVVSFLTFIQCKSVLGFATTTI